MITNTKKTLYTATTPSATWEIVEVTLYEQGQEIPYSEPIHVLKDGEYQEAFGGGSWAESHARDYIAAQLSAEDIAAAFVAAKDAVANVPAVGNAGTCNHDTPEVKIPAYRGKRFAKAAEMAGVELYKLSGRWSKGWAWVLDLGVGSNQGDQRTREARAASEAMASGGLRTSVHYSMD